MTKKYNLINRTFKSMCYNVLPAADPNAIRETQYKLSEFGFGDIFSLADNIYYTISKTLNLGASYYFVAPTKGRYMTYSSNNSKMSSIGTYNTGDRISVPDLTYKIKKV